MRIWHYGDDINTDMLFPGKYTYTCATPAEILPHLLEDLDANFARAVRPGDVLIAGRNFGCGSSREQPVVGLKAAGVAAIIARGFARIFYRAAINQGLLLVECPAAVEFYQETAEGKHADVDLAIDAAGGTITINSRPFNFPKLPAEIMAICDAGGLLEYTRAKLRARGQKAAHRT